MTHKETLLAQQEQQLKELAENWQANPADMAEYLKFSAKFHRYSACNTALIYAQNPAALFCASYKKFKRMGYPVRHGEHGMTIRIYMPQRFYAEYPGADWKPLKEAGRKARHSVEIGLYMYREDPHFGYGKVFDIAQTTCPPEDYPKLLGVGYDSKPHAELYKALCVYCEKNGITTAEKNMHGVAIRGTHNPAEQKITTNSLLRDTQKVSTQLHEMAHNFLGHEPGKTPTMQAEFEADALSIMLGAQFGIEPTEARLQHFVESYEHFSEQLIADGKDVSVNNLFHNVRLVYQNRIDKLLTVVDAQLGIEHTSQMQLIGADAALEEPFEVREDAYVERPDLGECYRPRLFVDMDGTLANFHAASNYLEKMWEPGYFEQLAPYSRAVETVDLYRATYPDGEIFVISATIDSPTCVAEKNAWLDKHLPHIDADHRIFVPMGEDKSQYIPDGIRRTDILLDDYNKNLNEWQKAGGTSVKFVNEINDRGLHGEPFKGERIAYTAEADRSVYQLSRLISSIEPVPITAKQTQEVERTQEEKKEAVEQIPKRFSVELDDGLPPFGRADFDTKEEANAAMAAYYAKYQSQLPPDAQFHVVDNYMTADEEPTPRPVGRLDFLYKDRQGQTKIGESCYYYTEESFLNEVKEQNYYGVPMVVNVFRDENGQTIPTSFAQNLDPLPQGFKILDYTAEEEKKVAATLLDKYQHQSTPAFENGINPEPPMPKVPEMAPEV